MPRPVPEIAGHRFSRLVALEIAGRGGRQVLWRCQCDCGKLTTVATGNLRSGHTRSCGCLVIEFASAAGPLRETHGLSKTPEYNVWHGMVQRCHNPKNKGFNEYGGRGITVCDEWRTDFRAFFAHIGQRPSMKHSVDRIRNNEGYKPGNVRWATQEEQGNNKRVNVIVSINGAEMTLARAARAHGIHYSTVRHRLTAGASGADLVKPPQRRMRNGD